MTRIAGCLSVQGQAIPLSKQPLNQICPYESFNWISPDRCCWLRYTQLFTDDSPQLIHSQCGRYTLIFCGRIYNHLDIRRGLRYQTWKGDNDTETLVEGLAQRGSSLLIDLRGMFAFAFYDAERKKLLLARDRIGIKPLYWQQRDSGLYFSTETRWLFSDQFNYTPAVISHFLSFGYFPSEGELGEGIYPLAPGTLMRIGSDEKPSIVRWWPPSPRPDWTPLPIKNRRDAKNLLRQELERSVCEYMSGDGPVSCLISGASSSHKLAALAARYCSNQLHTFSVFLQGSDSEERKIVRDLANYLGTSHEEIIINNDVYVEHFVDAINSLDLPSFHAAHTYVVGKALKLAGTKTILFGLDSQECWEASLSGYRLVAKLVKLRVFELWPQLLKFADLHLYTRLEDAPHIDTWHILLAHHRQLTCVELEMEGLQALDWPKSPPCRFTQFFSRVCWQELYGYFEPSRLRDIDQVGRMVGIETRMPLLDHRLLELFLRIPQLFRLLSKKQSLLDLACEDILPKKYLDLPTAFKNISLPDKLLNTLLLQADSLNQESQDVIFYSKTKNNNLKMLKNCFSNKN